jgi:hypothetical protein
MSNNHRNGQSTQSTDQQITSQIEQHNGSEGDQQQAAQPSEQQRGQQNNHHPQQPANRSTSEQPKYPSGEILFSAIQREYDKEDERSKTLDSRVGILITLSAALLAFVSTYIKIPDFKKIKVETVYDALPYAIFVVLLYTTMLILVFSLIYSVRIITIRSYKRVKLEDFEKPINLQAKPDVIASALITIYRKNIEHNQAINDDKVKMYRRATYCITAAIILAIVVYMVSVGLS